MNNAVTLSDTLKVKGNTTLSGSLSVGKSAMVSDRLEMGGTNIKIGINALSGNTSDYNVGVGYQAGLSVSTGVYNTLLGGLAGDQSVVSVRPLVDDFLRSPAARQMLTDHFDAHITSGTDFDDTLKLPQKNTYNPIFFNGLNALTASGFPENTRNVSIINGSGIGNPYQDKNGMDISPDFLALEVTGLSIAGGLADADFTSRFTPLEGQENTTGSIVIDAIFICFCDFAASATVMAESFSDGIDAAPGGLFDISSVTGDIPADPLVDAFFAGLNTDQFNFIPAVSSMALEITENHFATSKRKLFCFW